MITFISAHPEIERGQIKWNIVVDRDGKFVTTYKITPKEFKKRFKWLSKLAVNGWRKGEIS